MKIKVYGNKADSNDRTVFAYHSKTYRAIFEHLESIYDAEIEYHNNLREKTGRVMYCAIEFPGLKPILIDADPESFFYEGIDEHEWEFILKMHYRNWPDFYLNNCLCNWDRVPINKPIKNRIYKWTYFYSYDRGMKPNEKFVDNYDKEINLLFLGTDSTVKNFHNEKYNRKNMLRDLQPYIPEQSKVGLWEVWEYHYSVSMRDLMTQGMMKIYLEQIEKARIGLSVWGGLANFRELEFFSKCIPCIMPTYQVDFMSPLIDGMHYVSYDVENPESFVESYGKLQDRDFYGKIAANAYAWWKENSSTEKAGENFIRGCLQDSNFEKWHREFVHAN